MNLIDTGAPGINSYLVMTPGVENSNINSAQNKSEDIQIDTIRGPTSPKFQDFNSKEKGTGIPGNTSSNGCSPGIRRYHEEIATEGIKTLCSNKSPQLSSMKARRQSREYFRNNNIKVKIEVSLDL